MVLLHNSRSINDPCSSLFALERDFLHDMIEFVIICRVITTHHESYRLGLHAFPRLGACLLGIFKSGHSTAEYAVRGGLPPHLFGLWGALLGRKFHPTPKSPTPLVSLTPKKKSALARGGAYGDVEILPNLSQESFGVSLFAVF